MPDAHVVQDPVVLRAIAHPLRNRILGELAATGPMRAADVARALDVPANQASFHLRQLAKYGLVEEDHEAARDKRDRVWRTVAEDGLNIDLTSLAGSRGGEAAAAVYRRTGAARSHALVERAWESERGEAAHHSITDANLRLTKHEADQFREDLGAVLEQWVARTRADGAPDDGRRTYALLQVLQPEPAVEQAG